MTQKDKSLLFKDLCARLPYNTKVFFSIIEEDEPVELSLSVIRCLESIPLGQNDIVIKPYLRSMKSMTAEEKEELIKNLWGSHTAKDAFEELSWYLSKHLDVNGLIPKGLAIEVTEENNPYKD